ncbi:hypothetical protein LTR27_001912 [Elasticomyces elasticus]|nr:hypothetical protein LTR27_001912 [Elasticomyces elasticus]
MLNRTKISMKKRQDLELPRIFTLLPELRNRIWEFVVTETVTSSKQQPYPRTPGLVRTCRQARKEALGIWMREVKFSILIQDLDMAWMHETYQPSGHQIARTARKLGVMPKITKHYTISLNGALNWHNLLQSLRAFHRIKNSHCPIAGGGDAESKVIIAAYGMVETMRGKVWAVVEKRLEEWHDALAAMDTRWT